MNRLHVEGERRSNDFGHRTIADKTKGLASAHLNIQPTRRTCQKKAGRAGRIGESRRLDLQSQPIEPAGRPVASGWGRFSSLCGPAGRVRRACDDAPPSVCATLEPDESDHFRIRPARFAVQTHRPASRCVFATHPTCSRSRTTKDNEGWFGTKFPDDADELLFLAPGVVKDVALLKSLFELLANMLDQLCRIRVTTKQDPGVSL